MQIRSMSAAPYDLLCASRQVIVAKSPTAPNGGSARGYKVPVMPLADATGRRPGRQYVYTSLALA